MQKRIRENLQRQKIQSLLKDLLLWMKGRYSKISSFPQKEMDKKSRTENGNQGQKVGRKGK